MDNAISISEIIDQNEAIIKNKYLNTVFKIGSYKINNKKFYEYLKIRDNLSYWWLSLINEKSNAFKSKNITDIIRIYALEIFLNENHFDDITLKSDRKPLIKSLKNWFKFKDIYLNIESEYKINKFTKSRLPHCIQAFLWIIRFAFNNRKLINSGKDKWHKSEAKITFVSYLFNIENNDGYFNKFNSKYWTSLISYLDSKKIKTNWLHIYIKDELLPNSKSAAAAIDVFNNNKITNQSHVTLESFLSLYVIVITIFDYLKLIFHVKININPIKKIYPWFWPLLKYDWNTTFYGKDALNNLLMLNLFEEAFKNLKHKQTHGVFLKEDIGWETGLIYTWKKMEYGKIMGFIHSTVRFWDLRYFFDKQTLKNCSQLTKPLPDYIGCGSDSDYQILKDDVYKTEILYKVEALRYDYLIKLQNKKPQLNKKTLLVLGDYIRENNLNLIKILKKSITNINDIRIVFKPHPSCKINLKEFGNLNVMETNNSISEILVNYKYVFCGHLTAAALDAYYSGLTVITLLDAKYLNLSPLKDHENCIFIRGKFDFIKFINNDTHVSKIENNIYLNKKLPSWDRFLLETE